jgi:HTH-type transcriptional regulator / antitoxin HigA
MEGEQVMPADPKEILKTWVPFKEALGITRVRTRRDYARARATMDALLDEIGDDEKHPLAEVLDYLADRIRAYEDGLVSIPEAPASEVLRFLMDQHGLTQKDLADCVPQSRISDYLSGRRQISRQAAKKLAERFNVRADLLL